MPTLFPPDYPVRPDAPLLSFGPSFAEEIARSVIHAIWHENDEQPHETETRAAAGLTMFEGFHPRDHVECMLAAQGVAAHCAIMESLKRAMLPDQPEPVAIKLRSGATGLYRMFSGILRDLERRQAKPLPLRPDDDFDAPEPGDPPPDGPAPRAKRAASRPSPANDMATPDTARQNDAPAKNRPVASPPNFDDVPEIPEDIKTRPDGTPGSLTAYAPKVEMPVVIPREAPIMVALATRPKPYRMVNAPGQSGPAETGDASPNAPDIAEKAVPEPERRGPLDLTERMFTGDALAQFTSSRLDPNAPVEPFRFELDHAVVELELISTGDDPAAEADRAAMMAAHPDGKPIVTLRYGAEMPADVPPEKPPDDG